LWWSGGAGSRKLGPAFFIDLTQIKYVRNKNQPMNVIVEDFAYTLEDRSDHVDTATTDTHVIVGQLFPEEDASHPLEDCDGMGRIYSFSSRYRNGIDQDEAKRLMKENRYALPLSYYEHGNCLWDVQGGPQISRCPDMQWDGVRFAGLWVPDACIKETADTSLWRYMLPNPEDVKITFGKPLVIKVGDREFRSTKSWDTTWKEVLSELGIQITRESRAAARLRYYHRQAEIACDLYTKWCNGDCWWAKVTVFEKESDAVVEEDALSDLLGYCEAQDELKSQLMEPMVRQFSQYIPNYNI
jgi:hypothetical protein